MQWSQIKTLFILCFLVLDVYLLFQFFDKQNRADLGLLEPQVASIEDRLKTENITISKLPENASDESFLSVKPKTFTDDELKRLDALKNQHAIAVNKKMIISEFEKPVPVPVDSMDKMESLVKKSVIFPDEYRLWSWNKDANVLLLFQEKSERPVYFNQNGMILVFLNDDNEMIGYTQTMLGEAEHRVEKKTLITPIKAIETLYKANELLSGDEVTKVDIGFHTRVPLENGVQVFVPTWKVKVNDEKDYFVNAIEGFVFSGDECAFIKDVITTDMERIRTLDDKSEMKDKFLNQLQTRLYAMNRSEKE
jgi:regulatory protein YycI of two-component signal transduction system YycFG